MSVVSVQPSAVSRQSSAFIKFLGTAGTRFVVSKQMRASGGIWLFLNGVHLHLDPGPGALVKSIQSQLNPQDLSAVILSHRHLDHSNDVNIMIEAMTNGGTIRKGTLFCPQDALDNDPIVFEYIRGYVKAVEILREGARYRIVGDRGDGRGRVNHYPHSAAVGVGLTPALSQQPAVGSQEKTLPWLEFDVPVRNIHGSVQAYGLRFFLGDAEGQRDSAPHPIHLLQGEGTRHRGTGGEEQMPALDNPCDDNNCLPAQPRDSRPITVSSVNTVGYIGDTGFFDGLINAYQGIDLLIINAVIENPMPGVDHLCVEDVITLIKGVSPRLAILTHFGLSMIDARPDSVAEKIAGITQVNTIAGSDGMEVWL